MATEEFKFNCPKCGQKIAATPELSGREIDCPACKNKITIPAPAEAQAPPAAPKPAPPITVPKETPQAQAEQPSPKAAPEPAPQSAPPAASKPAAPVSIPKQASQPAASQAPKVESAAAPQPATPEAAATSEQPSVAQEQAATAAAPKEPPPQKQVQTQVAVLTPAIKLEMVRAVRKRISDPSHWVSGKTNGSNTYAAKADGKETVDPKSPEAARFSLIGAFLLELHLRQVISTASGRRRFLDEEIPEAIGEVLLNEMSDEERESENPLEGKDLMAVSHAQCLAALDNLEDRYSHRMEEVRAEKAKTKLGNVRLGDIVKKLEAKDPIQSDDIATALYHELMDIRRRLERLERRQEQKE